MVDQPALTLSPPLLTDRALCAVLAAVPDARLVGGCVRDSVAGQPIVDIDLATAMAPDAVMAALRAAGIRAVPTGLAHGTVTAVLDKQSFEITTLRRDVETDGRHASVAWTDDWREDAARRDFTINALSMNRDGQVFDYFGGLDDLAAGHVRFVGDPATRLAEDRLRALRFFRFQARYGRGAPDAAAMRAVAAAVPDLGLLSPERVWSELRRILIAPDPAETLAQMQGAGVLGAVLPEGADPTRLRPLPPDPILRLAAILTGDPVALAGRLHLSNAERDRLVALRAGPVPDPAMDDDALRRLLADTPAPILAGRAWLAGSGDTGRAMDARLQAMPIPVFPLEGRDAIALGVAPGREMGRLLRRARDWWLAGGCVADASACRAELARLRGA